MNNALTVGRLTELLKKLPDDTKVFLPDNSRPTSVRYESDGVLYTEYDEKDIKPVSSVSVEEIHLEGFEYRLRQSYLDSGFMTNNSQHALILK